MKKRLASSIRAQVTLIIALSIALTLAMGAVFFSMSLRALYREREGVIERLMLQASGSISQQLEEMRYIANSMANNSTVRAYLSETQPSTKRGHGETLSGFAGDLLQYSPIISHILLVSPDCQIFSPTQHNVAAVDYLDNEYHIFDRQSLASGLIAPITNAADTVPYCVYYTPVYSTSGPERQQKIGTCLVFMPLGAINRTLSAASSQEGGALMLVNERGEAFCSGADNSLTRALARSDLSSLDGVSANGKYWQLTRRELAGSGWTIISADDASVYAHSLSPLMWQGLFSCLLFILIAIVWTLHVRHNLTRPLTRLARFAQSQPGEGLRLRLPEGGSNEIGVLYRQINQLLDSVSSSAEALMENQKQIYELEIARNKAELNALQSQINPHFLYNTLDCIKGYGYMLGSAEVVTITNALASIMRYCIKGPEFVPVRRELAVVKDYLSIISIRFKDRFKYIYALDEELMDVEIPRFILQPLIENAVYHGLEPKPGSGTLRIACEKDGNNGLRFVIADDGLGMSEGTLSRLRERLLVKAAAEDGVRPDDLGLALPNIQARIRHIYGKPYGLSVESEENRGTTITLTLPCRRKEG